MLLNQGFTTLSKKGRLILFALIPVLSLLLHFHVFNMDLLGFHVWRQTETQTVIDNFYREDFNILNSRVNNRGNGTGIFRMEFPIMQWLFACVYKVFGYHIIISRILTFILGLFSVWGMYRLVYAIFRNENMALIAAWCFNFSPLFYYYTMNPIPDNFAVCTSIWGMAYFFEWIAGGKNIKVLWSAFFLGLAILAKMPFAVYLGGIGVYFVAAFFRKEKTERKRLYTGALIYTICLLAPALWYLSVVSTWHGNGIVQGILSVTAKDIPRLLDIMVGNLISTLPEMLVNYGALLFFLAGVYFLFRNKANKKPLFIVFLFWGISVILYFLFEMNMIGMVHDYYMFPFLPLLFIIVSYGGWHLFNQPVKWLKALSIVAICILPLTAFIRIDHRWNLADPGFNRDLMVYKTDLQHAVPDNAIVIAGNDVSPFIFLYYINKKGWVFNNDSLSAKDMEAMVILGAKYLYSDSRKVEADTGVNKFIDKLIAQKGSIKVFSLK
ncbi:MAG TPA: glycosyltransferase family 39 protein [Bacteroidia bacterium]|jgi:4-amino-4-deoxy-L-arabinose transferase-like glycosyltransferase|nr:glycosyltransferase family 39 protein [Bacteroidia bacterium]